MKSWHLIVDVARCHDCNDCFLADKDEFVDNEFPPYSAAQPWHGHRWMNIKRKERGQYPLVETAYLPLPCMHCDDAPCLTADGAVYKREDGLVIIDPVKAKGLKEIVGELSLLGHLLERGEGARPEVHRLRPPAGRRLDRDALQSGVPHRGHQVRDGRGRRVRAPGRRRGSRALPRLPRHASRASSTRTCTAGTKAFVGCSVVFGDSDECGEGATVTVSRDGALVGEGTTDIFGEVKIDHLDPGREYAVRIVADGYQPAEMTLKVDASLNAGTVTLQKA